MKWKATFSSGLDLSYNLETKIVVVAAVTTDAANKTNTFTAQLLSFLHYNHSRKP